MNSIYGLYILKAFQPILNALIVYLRNESAIWLQLSMIAAGTGSNEKISLGKFIEDKNGYTNESKSWHQLSQSVAASARDY
jgi:hypothetical protein